MFGIRFGISPRVSVVHLEGRIGDNLQFVSARQLLRDAFNQPNLAAVCLVINSPGGCPVNSSLLANYILYLSEKKRVPVLAFVDRVAASGGYILALAAHKIFVNEYSMVGSIGAVMKTMSFQDLLENLGVKPLVLTAGQKKGMMNPLQSPDEDALTECQGLLNQAHHNFKTFVNSRRGEKLKQDEIEEIFSGNIFMGSRAVELGLADDVYAVMEVKLAEEINMADFKMVHFERKVSRLRKIFSRSLEMMAQLFN